MLNDEAHHCYRHRIVAPGEEGYAKLTGDDRKEAESREQDARVWISGHRQTRGTVAARPWGLPTARFCGSVVG